MIPSIDYLTLVLAGAVLYKVGLDTVADGRDAPARPLVYFGWIVEALGVILFSVGTARAFMGAVGL